MTNEPMTNWDADPPPPPPSPGPPGEWEPALVEGAVLHATRGHPRERGFRRERDRLYEIVDPEAREAAFRELHATWFERLPLGPPRAPAPPPQPAPPSPPP